MHRPPSSITPAREGRRGRSGDEHMKSSSLNALKEIQRRQLRFSNSAFLRRASESVRTGVAQDPSPTRPPPHGQSPQPRQEVLLSRIDDAIQDYKKSQELVQSPSASTGAGSVSVDRRPRVTKRRRRRVVMPGPHGASIPPASSSAQSISKGRPKASVRKPVAAASSAPTGPALKKDAGDMLEEDRKRCDRLKMSMARMRDPTSPSRSSRDRGSQRKRTRDVDSPSASALGVGLIREGSSGPDQPGAVAADDISFLRLQRSRGLRESRALVSRKMARIVVDHWKALAQPRLDLVKAGQIHEKRVRSAIFDKWRQKSETYSALLKREFIVRTTRRFKTLHGCFTIWRDKYRRALAFKFQEEKKMLAASEFARAVQIGKVLSQLGRYARKRIEGRKNIEKAIYSDYRRLLKKSFQILRARVLTRKKKREVYEFADGYARRLVKRRTLKTWRRKLREEIVLLGKMDEARAFYEFRLKKSGIRSLQNAIAIRKKHDAQRAQADEFYVEKVLLRGTFRLWARNVKRAIAERTRLEEQKADDIFRCRFLSVVLNVWRARTKQNISRGQRLNAFRAVRRRGVYRRVFVCLSKNVVRMKQKREQQTFADSVFTIRVFTRWRKNLRAAIRREKRLREVDGAFRVKFLRRHFQVWAARSRELLRMERLQDAAAVFHRRKVLKRAFGGLLMAFRAQRRIVKDERMADDFSSLVLLVRHFRRWRRKLAAKYVELEKEKVAHDFHNKRLVRKVFDRIRSHAAFQKEKRRILEETVLECQARLQRGKLRRAFLAWKAYHAQRVKERIFVRQFVASRKVALAKRTFSRWHAMASQRQLESKKVQKVVAARDFRLKREALDLWRHRLQQRKDLNVKLRRARKFHHRRFLRKAIKCWRTFVDTRKLHRKQKLEALARRRRMLLRRGVVDWVEAAAKRRDQRYLRRFQIDQFPRAAAAERSAVHWEYLTMNSGKPYSHFRKPFPIVVPSLPSFRRMEPGRDVASLLSHRPSERPPPRRPVSLLLPGVSPLPRSRAPPREEEEEGEVAPSVGSTSTRRPSQASSLGLSPSFVIGRPPPASVAPIELREQEVEDMKHSLARQKRDLEAHRLSMRREDRRVEIKAEIGKIEAALRQYDELRLVYLQEKGERADCKEQLRLLRKLNGDDASLQVVRYTKKLRALEDRARAFLRFREEKMPQLQRVLELKMKEYATLLRSTGQRSD